MIKNMLLELTEKGFKRIKDFSWEICANKTVRIYKDFKLIK